MYDSGLYSRRSILGLLMIALVYISSGQSFAASVESESKNITVQYFSMSLPTAWNIIPESALGRLRNHALEDYRQVFGIEYPGEIDFMIMAQEPGKKVSLFITATHWDSVQHTNLEYVRDENEKRAAWGVRQKRILPNYQKHEFDIKDSHVMEYKLTSTNGELVSLLMVSFRDAAVVLGSN